MQGLPQEMQYRPTPAFQQALGQLNSGLVEAGQRAAKPITAQQSLNEVMLPLFNLLANYIKMSQRDTYGYFYGLCALLYQQQQEAADDNVILAVDPDLAEEVASVTEAARENIGKAKAFILRVQEYLRNNKPEVPAEGAADEALSHAEAALEQHQALRQDALRVMSLLQETVEDLGVMSDNVDAAVYEPDEEGDEGDEEGDEPDGDEPEDEVALPGSEPEDDAAYESIVG